MPRSYGQILVARQKPYEETSHHREVCHQGAGDQLAEMVTRTLDGYLITAEGVAPSCDYVLGTALPEQPSGALAVVVVGRGPWAPADSGCHQAARFALCLRSR